MRVLVGLIVYRSVVSTLHGQGVGRFTAEELTVFKREAFESLAALLAEARSGDAAAAAREKDDRAPFWVLGGETPTEADTTFYGFVAGCLICEAQVSPQRILMMITSSMLTALQSARNTEDGERVPGSGGLRGENS